MAPVNDRDATQHYSKARGVIAMFVSTKIVKSLFTALTGLAIAGSLIGTASAAVPGNTAVVTGRVTTGALTATIAVKTGLPDVAYSTTSQNTSGTLLLTVDDAS